MDDARDLGGCIVGKTAMSRFSRAIKKTGGSPTDRATGPILVKGFACPLR